MTGAEYIARFLVRKGVEVIFGYPGASVLDLYDSISKTDIKHILMRHEQGASLAASGYAKASGKVGLCIATSGPGAANLVTGIADAYLDSAPMLIITGQVDTAYIGRDAFQEADILGITMPITKHSYLVRNPAMLKKSLWEAWEVAISDRPGPVLIDVAQDIFKAEFDDADPSDIVLPRKRSNSSTVESQLDQINDALSQSHRPLILAGGGVVTGKASKVLSKFSAKSGIPVAFTLPGMGLSIDSEYRADVNILGLAGIYGSEAANAAMEQCDLVIAIGCRMSDRTVRNFKLFSEGRRIIHCDIDSAEINKNVVADIPVVCDAAHFLETLCNSENIRPANSLSSWNEYLKSLKTRKPISIPEQFLSCREILRALNNCEAKRNDALYVADVGNHQMRAAREIEPCFERGFITSCGLGAMGFGRPGAIGASFSPPEGCKQIIAICGDGGFQMTLEELAVLKATKLPIKIFLFDNFSLGMIRKMQDSLYEGRHTDSELDFNPDFELLAQAYGLDVARLDVSARNDLETKLNEILDKQENLFVHCVTGDLESLTNV